ncbi:MAG: hypothetical protein ACYTF1_15535, partial [Planctomycetota bacterium]
MVELSCRAFGVVLRREQFVPFNSGHQGFTLTLRHEGQLQLVILPLSAHESHVLMTTPIRSGLLPENRDTMPSADFCR